VKRDTDVEAVIVAKYVVMAPTSWQLLLTRQVRGGGDQCFPRHVPESPSPDGWRASQRLSLAPERSPAWPGELARPHQSAISCRM
jgi:hypothetical protein